MLLTTLTSALGLLAVAGTITELALGYVVPHRAYFKERIQEVVDKPLAGNGIACLEGAGGSGGGGAGGAIKVEPTEK